MLVNPARATDYGTIEVKENGYYFWSWNLKRGDVIAWSCEPHGQWGVNLFITTQTEFDRFKEGQEFYEYEWSYLSEGSEYNHDTFRVIQEGAWVLFLYSEYADVKVDYVITILTPEGEKCPSAVPQVTTTMTETAPPVTITETTYKTETTTEKTMSEFALPAVLGLTLFAVFVSVSKQRRN